MKGNSIYTPAQVQMTQDNKKAMKQLFRFLLIIFLTLAIILNRGHIEASAYESNFSISNLFELFTSGNSYKDYQASSSNSNNNSYKTAPMATPILGAKQAINVPARLNNKLDYQSLH